MPHNFPFFFPHIVFSLYKTYLSHFWAQTFFLKWFFLLNRGNRRQQNKRCIAFTEEHAVCCTLLTKMSAFPKCLTMDSGLYKTNVYALIMKSPLNLCVWPEAYYGMVKENMSEARPSRWMNIKGEKGVIFM